MCDWINVTKLCQVGLFLPRCVKRVWSFIRSVLWRAGRRASEPQASRVRSHRRWPIGSVQPCDRCRQSAEGSVVQQWGSLRRFGVQTPKRWEWLSNINTGNITCTCKKRQRNISAHTISQTTADDQQNEPKTKLELMAEMRDYKRRRQSYRAKNVHITKKSYTEVNTFLNNSPTLIIYFMY